MGLHDHHNHCEHELKYCEKCDVVYCKKCSKEWKTQTYYYTYPTYPWTWTSGTYSITTSDEIKCCEHN